MKQVLKMCEFRVKLKDGNVLTDITEGIVFCTIKDGEIIFRGLGVEKKVSGGIITEFNVIGEESAYIHIVKSPIISEFLKFIDKEQENKNGNLSKTDLLNEWEKVNGNIKNFLMNLE